MAGRNASSAEEKPSSVGGCAAISVDFFYLGVPWMLPLRFILASLLGLVALVGANTMMDKSASIALQVCTTMGLSPL
jgi:hypothetical protein